MDVELLQWPAEDERRRALAEGGVPRLLILDSASIPPLTTDPLEDWVRFPTSESDRVARCETLRRRAGLSGPQRADRPSIDRDGLVHAGTEWVAAPPIEARLAEVLIDRFGTVVGREELSATAWPGQPMLRNALDVRILRLRRRLGSVGLTIRTVRSRGYLLEWGTPDPEFRQAKRI